MAEVVIDRTLPAEKAPTRKPGIGLMGRYLSGEYDLDNSYVIGDRATDIEFAGNLGCRGIYFSSDQHREAVLCTESWQEIFDFLVGTPRKAEVRRETSETAVEVDLNLDGSGSADIKNRHRLFRSHA